MYYVNIRKNTCYSKNIINIELCDGKIKMSEMLKVYIYLSICNTTL